MLLPGPDKKPMVVVLDTNVLISALVYKKRLGKIGDWIEQGRITPCFIALTWAEFENVLHYPKLQRQIAALPSTPEEIAQSISPQSQMLTDPVEIPNIVRHPGDNNILAAAVAAKAMCIVTGDAELLNLKTYKDIPIMHPVDFLNDYA